MVKWLLLLTLALPLHKAHADDPPPPDPLDVCTLTSAPSDFPVDEKDRDFDDCTKSSRSASSCCLNPQSCPNGGFATSGGGSMDGLMKMMVTMEAAVLISQSSPGQMNDMSALCNMFGMGTGGGGAANTGFTSACGTQKSQCSNLCESYHRKWAARAQKLKTDCWSSDKDDMFNRMQGIAAGFERHSTDCEGLTANASVQAQAKSMNGANQGAMQNVCSQLAQQPTQSATPQQLQPLTPPSTQAMVDCSNPVVLAQMGTAATSACSACAQANNGQPCAQAIVDKGSVPGFERATGGTTNANEFNVQSGADGKLAQNPVFPNATPGVAPPVDPYADMMGGATGGGPMLGANGYPMGPPAAAARQGYYGSSIRTDILQGERGGNGYSGPPGGTLEVDASNPFMGYGTGAPEKLDLRQYLPGAKFSPRRKLAGVGSINPDINTFTTDLFKRISDRFRVICSMNRLRDCDSARQPN